MTREQLIHYREHAIRRPYDGRNYHGYATTGLRLQTYVMGKFPLAGWVRVELHWDDESGRVVCDIERQGQNARDDAEREYAQFFGVEAVLVFEQYAMVNFFEEMDLEVLLP
jgi:hypothetical protein